METKEQHRKRNKEYYKTHKEQHRKAMKKWRLENKEQIRKEAQEYYQTHKEERRCYLVKNADKYREFSRKWGRAHPETVAECGRRWRKTKGASEYYRNKNRVKRAKPEGRIESNLRSRVWSALKGKSKSFRTLQLIGCDFEALRLHIEMQFQDGMSWANYGLHGWHIDHIRPCSSFDLSDPEQQKACFHYSNLQPLWAVDNLRKARKIA